MPYNISTELSKDSLEIASTVDHWFSLKDKDFMCFIVNVDDTFSEEDSIYDITTKSSERYIVFQSFSDVLAHIKALILKHEGMSWTHWEDEKMNKATVVARKSASAGNGYSMLTIRIRHVDFVPAKEPSPEGDV